MLNKNLIFIPHKYFGWLYFITLCVDFIIVCLDKALYKRFPYTSEIKEVHDKDLSLLCVSNYI